MNPPFRDLRRHRNPRTTISPYLPQLLPENRDRLFGRIARSQHNTSVRGELLADHDSRIQARPGGRLDEDEISLARPAPAMVATALKIHTSETIGFTKSGFEPMLFVDRPVDSVDLELLDGDRFGVDGGVKLDNTTFFV